MTSEPSEAATDIDRARALIEARAWDAAENLLAEPAARDDADAATLSLYQRLLVGQGRRDRALEVGRAAIAKFPAEVDILARFCGTLVWSGHPVEALERLEAAIVRFPDNALVHALRAEALLMTGAVDEARAAIERTCELEPDSADHRSHKVAILAAQGLHDQAREMLCDPALDRREIAADFRRTIAYRNNQGCAAEAIALARGACDVLGAELSLVVALAVLLLEQQRPAEAGAALADIAVPAGTPDNLVIRFHRTRAIAMKKLGDRDGAISQLEKVLALAPQDEPTLRDLYILNQQLGRTEEMKTYGRHLGDAGSRKMPKTLAAGLSALHPREPRFERASLDWAWDLADKARWNRDAWLAAIEWGRMADVLLRGWWLTLPGRSAEIDALIDRPDPDPIAALPEAAPCLLVTTHLGPMAGAVRYFQTCGRPFRGFGFGGPDPVVDDGPPMRIAANRGSPAAALRELVREIRAGTLVGFAPDSPDVDESMRLDFLGHSIAMSTLVPRLMMTHRVPSLWCQPLWRDRRIAVVAEPLPEPRDGEAVDAWCRRWCLAYLAGIETVMRGAPENLNLGSGIWLNVKPKFILRKRPAA